MGIIFFELISCLSALTISFIYEGKGLLLLGKKNYKIRLGCFKNYDEELKMNFFPIMSKNANKLRFYIDYLMFLIPGFNIIYSLVEGNKKCNNIINKLLSKDIIISMNDDERQKYSNIKGILERINFTLFNSMDSYSKTNINLANNINECDLGEKSEYYRIKDEWYEKDVSYLASIFEFEQEKEEAKIRKLKI